MSRTKSKALVAVLVGAGSWAAIAGGDGRGPRGGGQDFIGVFRPIIEVIVVDTQRCPATHPVFFKMSGKALTTVGPLDFVQTHCEDNAHTSFRRGQSKMTAADGDVLYGTYKGQILHSPDGAFAVLDGAYANTGGTGKFAHSFGKGDSAGSIEFATGEVILAVTGSL